ncbi:hypothetical protein Tco_0660460 [Tanacetum coccineum]
MAFWDSRYEGNNTDGGHIHRSHRTRIRLTIRLQTKASSPTVTRFYILRSRKNLQILPFPQIRMSAIPYVHKAHDPNYVPEPIYPEYIPLEDDHEFPAEEQPLPPIDSPTAESPGYITESDPEEENPEGYEDDEAEAWSGWDEYERTTVRRRGGGEERLSIGAAPSADMSPP